MSAKLYTHTLSSLIQSYPLRWTKLVQSCGSHPGISAALGEPSTVADTLSSDALTQLTTSPLSHMHTSHSMPHIACVSSSNGLQALALNSTHSSSKEPQTSASNGTHSNSKEPTTSTSNGTAHAPDSSSTADAPNNSSSTRFNCPTSPTMPTSVSTDQLIQAAASANHAHQQHSNTTPFSNHSHTQPPSGAS